MNRLPACARVFAPLFILNATPAVFAAPANDNFASAAPLTVGVAANGTNVTATVEAGEPYTHRTLTANAAGTATGLSVWYKWTPAADGLASFTVIGTGAGAAAGAMQAAAYRGSALASLTRIASASSIAGTATAAPVSFASNVFEVQNGVPVFFQVTGNSATITSTFDITVNNYARPGKVVLPRYSSWEWLHTIDGSDPTAAATWANSWKIHGDSTIYPGIGAATARFTLDGTTPQRAPLGFATMDGAPGIVTAIGTPPVSATSTQNNAAYFRAQFTLPAETSNLWAEVVADDGAYIYIDDLPPFPVNIATKLILNAGTYFFDDYRPQPDAFLTGATNTGCHGFTPANFSSERNTTMVFLGGLTGKLSAGAHRIAVSLHQADVASSDLAFDLQLIDMGALPLSAGPASLTFTDTPYVGVLPNPGVEHSHAPLAGQTDLAWHCTTPDSALNQGIVMDDDIGGIGKKFLLNAAEAQRFVTEPINVTGLSQFVASLRILTNDTSSGFEPEDAFRVFLETSDDGINFTEPAPALDIQPAISGADALNTFRDVWVTKTLQVNPNPYRFVRLVISGGTNSFSESIYFDDISFGLCQLFPVVSNVTYINNDNNNRLDDTIAFDLTVTGSGTTGPGWTTIGFGAGNELTGIIGGGAVTVIRPAVDGTGAAQNVVLSIVDDGNPECKADITVSIPAAAIAAPSIPVVARNPGADPSTTADDTFTYTINVAGTATGSTYQIRSSDTGNTTLYGTGTYGTDTTLTLPAGVGSITFRDDSLQTLLRTVTVPPAGSDIAMARSILDGATRIVYSNPGASAFISAWTQTSNPPVPVTPIPPDLNLTVTETTATLTPTTADIVATEGGVLETLPVDVSSFTGVRVTAVLRAWEDSTGSGFEATDTFKLEVIETGPGGDTTTNLITGNTADANPADGTLNGSSAANAAAYDAAPGQDEFNLAASLSAANSSGTFNFVHNLAPGTTSVKVRASAANDSPNEFFFLKDILITNSTTVDSDGDGLPDDWETTNFGNLNQTAAGDADGDGQTNAAEFAAGTLPANGKSFMGITSWENTSPLIRLTFASVAGKRYIAQYSENLSTWTDAGNTTTATGASTTNTFVAPGSPGRYYFRIKLVP
ncbi:MAG TPA: hypothetical protein VG796_23625 [Verrucomicrobiales bacterium]|nr:hypothetical protein [Verrucomicrobiales bacterium]